MGDSNYMQFKPGTFFGGKRIDARPSNVEYQEGTGSGTGRIARRVDPGMGGGLMTFDLAQKYKDIPMSQINREANIRRDQGMMYNPNTGTFQRDSMYNRSGFGFGRGPVGDMEGQSQQAPAMTEPQQMWAQKAQEKMSGVGAPGKVGEKIQSIGDSAWGQPAALTPAPSNFIKSNPYAGTRQQNIANAKTAGEFDNIRSEYNRRNEAQGLQMDEDGNITKSPAIAAKDASAERSMMSDYRRGITRNTSGNTSSFSSPYGRGSITRNMAPGKPQSMVKDDFGNWVPMNPYLKDKEEVQKSKGMTGGSSVLSQNQTGKTAIPPNPLIKKKDNTNTSLNSSKEEAKSRESDEVSKEKQVSRKEDFIEAFNRKYFYNKNPDGEFHLSEDGDTIGVFDGSKLITFFSADGDPEKAVRNYRLYLKAIEDPMAKGDTLKANEYRKMLWRINLLGSDQDEEIRWFKEKFPDK